MDKQTSKEISTQDGNTKVNFYDYVKTEWKSEKREVISFRGNSELYKAFKPVSKALYGSTCRAFESFMASIVAVDRNKVNFCHTTQPINIDKIVIERNLRPRRAFEYAENVEETTEVKTVKKVKKVVFEPVPDYSGYSLEKLDRLHMMYRNSGNVGKSALVVRELKRRGVFENEG